MEEEEKSGEGEDNKEEEIKAKQKQTYFSGTNVDSSGRDAKQKIQGTSILSIFQCN